MYLKHSIHAATDCNATLHCSQLQIVLALVAINRSQLQISYTVRYFPATYCRFSSCRSMYAGQFQIITIHVHQPMKTCFIFCNFLPMGCADQLHCKLS